MFADTIVAIATPPGRGALALIRVSGPAALEIAARVVDPFRSDSPRVSRLARAKHPTTGEDLDQIVYTVHACPASYTGDDVVEISTHGGLLIPVGVLEALLVAGARQARPGEFTMRAVVNGKMDLLQAEAVADLIDSTAPAQRRAAINQLDRGLSLRIAAIRSQVLEVQVMMSYDIDFPDEDDGPVASARIEESAVRLLKSIDRLLETSGDGERMREGALAVIAGRPNSGKSSLFNALVGFDRAIVTEIEGTTRDAIEAPVTCAGFPFRLVDTAGLRRSDDKVEKLGIEVSLRYVEAADIVLLNVEAGREQGDDEKHFTESLSAPVVLVRTKADLCTTAEETGPGVPVSSVTGEGLARLRSELARIAFRLQATSHDVEPALTRVRHRTALTGARDEMKDFLQAYRDGYEAVVAGVHLQSCVGFLEEIIGAVTTEDVLDALFSEFCVGK